MLDVILEVEAKMSQYQLFNEHLTAIQTAIKASVCNVADKCSECGIIARSVHQSVVHGSKTPEERARELLIAVGDQIKTDEQIGEASSDFRFNKFVMILEEDPVHKNLVRRLKDACSSKERIRQSYATAREDREGQSRERKDKLQQEHNQKIPNLLPVSDCQIPEKDASIATRQQEIHTQEHEQATQEKGLVIEAKERQLRELNQQLAVTEQKNVQLQRILLQREKQILELQEEIQYLQLELDKVSERAMVTRKGKLTLYWKICKPAPRRMSRGSATVCGNMAYFRPDYSSKVYSYNSDTEEWSTLPECPREYFTIVVVNGLVTAVGGEQCTWHGDKFTNTLLSLVASEGGRWKWVEHFPPMPTKRYLPVVICSGKALVVAGGKGEEYIRLTTVEVMNTDTRRWSTVSSLPHPLSDASATVCQGRVYLVGGWDQHGHYTKSVFTCLLSDLLQSRTMGANTKRFFENHPIWHTIADLPVKGSTCVTLNGKLVAVGGRDPDEKATNKIYSYNTETNSWEIISHMLTTQRHCLVTILPGCKVMVVGGVTDTAITDKVQIATVQ